MDDRDVKAENPLDRALCELETAVFHALADPTRRALLELLQGQERPFSELAAPFAMTDSSVSQHLKVLRAADLVADRKFGKWRFYASNPTPLLIARDWIDEQLGSDHPP